MQHDSSGSDPTPRAEPPRADASASDASVPASSVAAPRQKEWWEEEGMPWKQKPGREDYWCMGWIAFMGLFGLAMLPLRGWLLGLNPQLLLGITGSRSGAAAVGALASQGLAPHWVWYLLAGTIMSIKFDWVFWWAGKLWGRGMIEVWAGRSERAAKSYGRAERWAQKLGWLGMFIAYVPIPLPLMQVIFVMFGASKMSLKRFVVLDFLASTTWLLFYIGLGWMIGEPAVKLLQEYAKYANYVAIALVVFVMGTVMFGQKKRPQAPVA
ncbi:DedA family protein [Propionibacteriaceae bacterium G1746]|uniref:DedA family protein n=1 Tax=Aestuariimicrobium sp. G57 TaxID=3418485 RepID=UPI003C242082